ncbi:energy transducer TonB [Mitsuaria sp. GD03876]|uniref:energy transducer TonB n=1 Tax=Mitsuaria sp. GD03876 TaxID=2975399 RepID=UPI002447A31C|nr:energy transducer TonB [Mitsuaria sp. GD03876]MDH0864977.1 energy transducer TonB [Mitsuaria sp. GD03876]
MSSRSLLSAGPVGLVLCQVLSVSLIAAAAHAQTAPAAAAADPKAQMSDVERAKRDADKVFQWIKFHAEKGEKKAGEKPHEAKAAEAPKPVARPTAVATAAPAAATTRRQDLDPVAERALAARNAAQDAGANAAPTVAAATPAPSPVAQTIAPATPAPQPLSETTSPQVVSMAAPATAAPAGKAPPEPEPAEADEPAPLKLLRKVDPEYPRALLSMQRQGSVLVQFTVRPDGSVDAPQALKSPDRKLSAAAINAVKQWRFEPIPAPRQVSVEIGFQVE